MLRPSQFLKSQLPCLWSNQESIRGDRFNNPHMGTSIGGSGRCCCPSPKEAEDFRCAILSCTAVKMCHSIVQAISSHLPRPASKHGFRLMSIQFKIIVVKVFFLLLCCCCSRRCSCCCRHHHRHRYPRRQHQPMLSPPILINITLSATCNFILVLLLPVLLMSNAFIGPSPPQPF